MFIWFFILLFILIKQPYLSARLYNPFHSLFSWQLLRNLNLLTGRIIYICHVASYLKLFAFFSILNFILQKRALSLFNILATLLCAFLFSASSSPSSSRSGDVLRLGEREQ